MAEEIRPEPIRAGDVPELEHRIPDRNPLPELDANQGGGKHHNGGHDPHPFGVHRVGTERADQLHGTNHADTLEGKGGNDRIWGYGGNDTIDGGTGNDTINGGAGKDTVHGGKGNDEIWGGNESDWLEGDAGNDLLFGGNGSDFLAGGADNDTLDGGDGKDMLLGESGDDKLYGGKENDLLIGGLGTDLLSGGEGRDTFEFQRALDSPIFEKADLIIDFEHGVDKIDLSHMDANLKVDGLQAFKIVEHDAARPLEAGELSFHFDAAHNKTVIEGGIGGAPGADFHVELSGNIKLDANDFELSVPIL